MWPAKAHMKADPNRRWAHVRTVVFLRRGLYVKEIFHYFYSYSVKILRKLMDDDGWCCTSHSTLFKSYRSDGRVIMKDCAMQRLNILSWIPPLVGDWNPRPCDTKSWALTTRPSISFCNLMENLSVSQTENSFFIKLMMFIKSSRLVTSLYFPLDFLHCTFCLKFYNPTALFSKKFVT